MRTGIPVLDRLICRDPAPAPKVPQEPAPPVAESALGTCKYHMGCDQPATRKAFRFSNIRSFCGEVRAIGGSVPTCEKHGTAYDEQTARDREQFGLNF